MADVIHKTTFEIRESVNTPDFPAGTWLINPTWDPDKATIKAVAQSHRKITGSTASEMSAAEKLTNPLPGVDAGESGSFKDPVRAATTAALPAHSRSGNVLTMDANGAFPAQDGITLTANQRLGVKNEGGGTHLENGLYILATVGDGTHPWKLQRSSDCNSDAAVDTGLTFRVQEGTVNQDRKFFLSTVGPITLNTTALTFKSRGYTEDTYANRPAAGVKGNEFYATDIGVLFKDDGAAWTVISDPWGFKFFEDEGFLTSGMGVEFAGLTTIPAESATILPPAAAWTITDSEGLLNWGGTTGISVVGWDFPALRSRVLIVAGGIHASASMDAGLFCQDAVLSGTEIDDGYLEQHAVGGVGTLLRESAGFTVLATPEDINITPDPSDPPWATALFYDDATDTIRSFVRSPGGSWVELASTTDSTFTTMKTVGLRYSSAAVNVVGRLMGPFMVFAEA